MRTIRSPKPHGARHPRLAHYGYGTFDEARKALADILHVLPRELSTICSRHTASFSNGTHADGVTQAQAFKVNPDFPLVIDLAVWTPVGRPGPYGPLKFPERFFDTRAPEIAGWVREHAETIEVGGSRYDLGIQFLARLHFKQPELAFECLMKFG